METSKVIKRTLRVLFIFSILMTTLLKAGTTGKLSGKITDENNEPVIGANVIIEGTYLGAAADLEGYYFINNIPPGDYRVIVSAVGYNKVIFENVKIKIDLTTKLDIRLTSTAVEVQGEVVVQAERPLVQSDLTSSSVTVSSDEIKMMPVENIHQVINLQAGVVGGHFRGGRSNEVAYLVDGISVTDPFNGGLSVQIENTSIREMEVISGTFNAEYGQAMSGVVNIVTQDGAAKYGGSVSAYAGDYYTGDKSTFQNLDKLNPSRIRDYQINLSGPVPFLKGLSFFTTGRYFYDQGYLYGKRVYNITDDVPVFPIEGDNSFWINRNTGGNSYVAMNPSRKYSFNGKVSYLMPNFKISYGLFWDDNWNKYYDHNFAWTPDGIMNHYRTNWIHNFQISHVISNSTFQTLKLTNNRFDYEGYVFEDPYDSRYVDPNRGTPLSNYTFRSGGAIPDRYKRHTYTMIGQWSLTSQVSKSHKIGAGLEARLHEIFNHNLRVVNLTENDTAGTFTLGYRNLGTDGNQQYTKYPYEISAYLQDKMEYDIMIINLGLRMDYFNPNSEILADLQNPRRNSLFENAGVMKKTENKLQFSPRLGVSFPITDKGIIHFSYGHFFQIPSFENLYVNSDYLVPEGGTLSSVTGNPDLKAQQTIMYEIGLQQVLAQNLSFDFTVYYRDIRNLLGMEIINTYEGIKYARFVNRDYGNVRGFIFTLDKRFADYFSAKLDYTYQIAEGNASDPYAVYNNNQSNPPVETNKKVVPLNWDQRSTLNLSLNVGVFGNWNAGIVARYGSGFPYTESIRISNGVRFENGGIKPATFDVDLRAEKYFKIFGTDFNLFLLVYNVLNIKNEVNVDPASGRANVDLYTGEAGTIYGLNTIDQFVNNPANYSAPRQVRFGFNLGF